MASVAEPMWWVELIKVSPGLAGAVIAAGVLVAYRRQIGDLFTRLTKFKALGLEAEFAAKPLERAIEAQEVQLQVSIGDRKSVLKRLAWVAPLLRDMRLLWVDDQPANNRNERALLEDLGVRVTTATTSAEAEKALRELDFTVVITDLKREGNPAEGIEFAARTWQARIYRWTIAYTGTPQAGLPVPPHLFGITNRPDHLLHLICDVAERERL